MKTFALAALATMAATAALAEGNAYRASGQRAGGPAYLANSETGGAVRPVRRAPKPAAYRHSNQRAGGPAGDAAAKAGPTSAQGTVYDPARTVPFGVARSGHAAGGPYRQ